MGIFRQKRLFVRLLDFVDGNILALEKVLFSVMKDVASERESVAFHMGRFVVQCKMFVEFAFTVSIFHN